MTRLSRSLAVLALVPVVALAACGGSSAPKTLSGYVLSPEPVVADKSLPDASNGDKNFAFKAAPGRLLIMYFGYMSCPDVCPTTLNEVKHALTDLGGDASKVDLAMATVDPGRDTGAGLTKYVQSFIQAAHALRTDDQTQLEAVAKAFGASYSVTTDAKGVIDVKHSAAIYVVDSTGTVILVWPYGILRDGITADLRILFDKGVQ